MVGVNPLNAFWGARQSYLVESLRITFMSGSVVFSFPTEVDLSEGFLNLVHGHIVPPGQQDYF